MAKKERAEIPKDIAARVLFLSNRTCCICEREGRPVQIHHIDENPANNTEANLSVLCLDCHHETQIRGGFDRKLDSEQVILYRDNWYAVMSQRRANASQHKPSTAEAKNMSLAISTPAASSLIRFDRLLFAKLLEQFPYNSNMIYFLKDCDVGDSFPAAWLNEIENFAQEWNDALHEFIDPTLEEKRADFMQKLILFKDGLWMNTWRSENDSDFLSMELDDFNDENPRWEKRDKLNTLGTETYNAHQELVRACKTVLGPPEAS
jgi:hypothetical protein